MTEEKINLLQMNLDLLYLSALSFIKENNLSIKDFGLHLGKMASQTWTSEQMTMEQIAKVFERNISLLKGAEVKVEKCDENEAILTVKGYPNENQLKMANLTLDDFTEYLSMYQLIAEKQNFKISRKADKDKFTLTLKR